MGGPPRPGTAWRSVGLPNNRPMVVQGGGGVAVLERREVGVLNRYIGYQRHVDPWFWDRTVHKLQPGDDDPVQIDPGVSHSKHREDQNYDHHRLDEQESSDAAAALEASSVPVAVLHGGIGSKVIAPCLVRGWGKRPHLLSAYHRQGSKYQTRLRDLFEMVLSVLKFL